MNNLKAVLPGLMLGVAIPIIAMLQDKAKEMLLFMGS